MVLIPPDAGLRLRTQGDSNLLQPTTPVAEIPAELAELRTGQTFTARIQEVLPDNTYRALVAGKQLTLQLPEGAKSGDTLELVVIDRTPRVVIARTAPDTVATKSAGDPYPYANLSRTGQMIGQLLLPEGETPQPAPLSRGQPLLAQPPTNAAELAPVLQKAVTQSGLFYESHQAQWAAGKLPTEQLLREPQGQRSAPAVFDAHGLPRPAPEAAARAPAVAPAPTLIQALFGGEETPAPATSSATPTTSTTASTGTTATVNAVPDELRPLVQQQLDAAATQRLVWHGEVWPQQAMDWEIVREDDGRQGGAENEAADWRTSLRLTMPSLGAVEAGLRLTASGIHLTLTTPLDDSADSLRGAMPRLAGALEAAGIPLLSFQVRHGGE